jgi:hypothetical protein
MLTGCHAQADQLHHKTALPHLLTQRLAGAHLAGLQSAVSRQNRAVCLLVFLAPDCTHFPQSCSTFADQRSGLRHRLLARQDQSRPTSSISRLNASSGLTAVGPFLVSMTPTHFCVSVPAEQLSPLSKRCTCLPACIADIALASGTRASKDANIVY